MSQNRHLAALLMLSAAAFIAMTTLLAKALGTDALGPPLHPVQITQGRFAFALLAIGTVASVLRPAFGRVHWRLHFGRTSCGVTGVTCMFAAAAMIPLADATAISFLNPIFAMLLAIPLLGEKVGVWRVTAALVGFCGALILIRPGVGAVEIGALVALAAAAALGLEVIFIKRLAGRERPLQVLLINNSIGLALSTLAAIAFWAPPTPAQWGALAGLGIAMACAQGCFLNAVARADASFVVPFSYAALVFAALYDAAIFGVLPGAASVLGAAVILLGAGLLAWREGRPRRAIPLGGPGGPDPSS